MKSFAFCLILCAFSACITPKAALQLPRCLAYHYEAPAHILEVEPSKACSVTIARANDKGEGLATVEEIARRNHAVAAINASFFQAVPLGAPAHILRIKDKWYAPSQKRRGVMGWRNFGKTTLFGYSDAVSSSADWKSMDYILGGTPLLVNKGEVITDFSPEQTRDRFLYLPRSRTAVGVKKNGNWVMVVIDGDSFLQANRGMTVPQLASYMKSLGCLQALNLDGGSSSSMFVYNQVKSKLSPGRKSTDKNGIPLVGDAVLVESR